MENVPSLFGSKAPKILFEIAGSNLLLSQNGYARLRTLFCDRCGRNLPDGLFE